MVPPSPRAGPFSSSKAPGDSGRLKALEGEAGQAGVEDGPGLQPRLKTKGVGDFDLEASGLRCPQAISPGRDMIVIHGTSTEMAKRPPRQRPGKGR